MKYLFVLAVVLLQSGQAPAPTLDTTTLNKLQQIYQTSVKLSNQMEANREEFLKVKTDVEKRYPGYSVTMQGMLYAK